MSEDKLVKDAVQEAQKSLEQEKQEALKQRVKSIVKATLEKIEEEEKIVKEHQDNVSILRKDLKDLETGRLDLIEERQDKDPKAKEISIVIIKKVERLEPDWGYKPWYWPFDIMFNNQWNSFTVPCGCNTSSSSCLNTSNQLFTLNGSTLSTFVPGMYELDSGNTIDIRPRF
jgi:hypothetical protein